MDSPELIDDAVDYHAEGNKAFTRMILAIIVSVLILIGLCSFITWGVLYLVDPIPHEWHLEELQSYPEPGLSSFSASELNGLVYLVGGHIGDPNTFNETNFSNVTQVYNFSSNSWSVAAPAPLPIQDHVIKTYNGHLYSFGGLTFNGGSTPSYRALSDVFRYDPVSNSWTLVFSLPRARWSHGVGLAGHLAFIIGGWDDAGTWYSIIDECDLNNLTCRETDWNIPRYQRAFSLVEVNNGQDFIIAGGYGKEANEQFSQILFFSPISGTISNVAIPALPFHDVKPALGASGDQLFIFGGHYSTDASLPAQFQEQIYTFSISASSNWDVLEHTLTHAKSSSVVVPLNGLTLGIFGGVTANGTTTTVESITYVERLDESEE